MKATFFFLIVILLSSCNRSGENGALKEADQKIQFLKKKNDSLFQRNLDLQDELLMFKNKAEKAHLKFDPSMIKKSLQKQGDLIPKESVLGGSMRFVSMDIINNKWILAQYEDGHVQGVSIYRYEHLKDSTFNFQLVDSATD